MRTWISLLLVGIGIISVSLWSSVHREAIIKYCDQRASSTETAAQQFALDMLRTIQKSREVTEDDIRESQKGDCGVYSQTFSRCLHKKGFVE